MKLKETFAYLIGFEAFFSMVEIVLSWGLLLDNAWMTLVGVVIATLAIQME